MWIRMGLWKFTTIFSTLQHEKRPFSDNITTVYNKLLEVVNNKTELDNHAHNMKGYHHQNVEEPKTRLNIKKLFLIINITITMRLFG